MPAVLSGLFGALEFPIPLARGKYRRHYLGQFIHCNIA